MDILKDFEQLLKSVNEVEKELQGKNRELSRVQGAINDITHYIEISDPLNASSEYGMYSMLREKLIERRNIKDEIAILRAIRDTFKKGRLSSVNQKSLTVLEDKIQKHEEYKKDRVYHTRTMTEIFGRCIEKS